MSRRDGTHVGARMRIIRRLLEMKQVEFAKALGCTQAFVSQVEHGRSGPSAGVMAALDRLGFSGDWLLTGTGDAQPRREESASVVRDGPLTARQLRILGRVPAGYPGQSPVVERVEGYFPMSYEQVPDDEAFCLRVKGDSMAPEIEEGDLVVVSPALRGKVVSGDLVVAMREPDDTWLKRYAKTEGRCILYSANRKYPPIILDGTCEVTIIGKVLYHIRCFR